MAYSVDDIIRVMREASSLKLSEVTVTEGDQKIRIVGNKSVETIVAAPSSAPAAVPVGMPAGAFAPADVSTAALAEEPEGTVIKSPMVGIFYSAPGPEAPDFVKVGDTVRKGQVLCIVEAMKLMNEIECDYNGRITKILVQNEQMVEFGQPLFEMEVQ